MDVFDKPPFRKPWSRGGIGFFVAFVLLVILVLTYGIKETVRYYDVKNKALSLVATGEYVIEKEDSDGDEYYNLIVAFNYYGKKYYSIYDSYSSRASAEAMIGKKVAVTINPSDPGEQLSDIAWNATLPLFIGSIMLCCVLEVVFTPRRKWYAEVYGWHRACIEKDVWRKHWQNMYQWLGLYGVALAEVNSYLMLRGDSGVVSVGALLFLGFGTILFVPWLKDNKLIRQGKFRHSVHTLVNKETKDNDGTDYFLVYSAGDFTWSHKVSWYRYDEAQMGETVVAVFLEDREKPHLVYDDLKDPTRKKSAVDKSGIL